VQDATARNLLQRSCGSGSHDCPPNFPSREVLPAAYCITGVNLAVTIGVKCLQPNRKSILRTQHPDHGPLGHAACVQSGMADDTGWGWDGRSDFRCCTLKSSSTSASVSPCPAPEVRCASPTSCANPPLSTGSAAGPACHRQSGSLEYQTPCPVAPQAPQAHMAADADSCPGVPLPLCSLCVPSNSKPRTSMSANGHPNTLNPETRRCGCAAPPECRPGR
jgi:hypothetical protein